MNLPMISTRNIGIVSMMIPIWFAAVYLILAGLRPEYSHLTKAISELGSVEAPRAWIWNLLGYIVPGLVVTLLGSGIGRQLGNVAGARLAARALMVSGLLMAFSGVFPGDFEDRGSPTMVLHAVGSIGSFAAFLFCGFTLSSVLRRNERWRWLVRPSLALVIASIFTGFLRTGNAPGLGQRLGFGCFFVWVALVGYGLWRDTQRPSADATERT